MHSWFNNISHFGFFCPTPSTHQEGSHHIRLPLKSFFDLLPLVKCVSVGFYVVSVHYFTTVITSTLASAVLIHDDPVLFSPPLYCLSAKYATNIHRIQYQKENMHYKLYLP